MLMRVCAGVATHVRAPSAVTMKSKPPKHMPAPRIYLTTFSAICYGRVVKSMSWCTNNPLLSMPTDGVLKPLASKLCALCIWCEWSARKTHWFYTSSGQRPKVPTSSRVSCVTLHYVCKRDGLHTNWERAQCPSLYWIKGGAGWIALCVTSVESSCASFLSPCLLWFPLPFIDQGKGRPCYISLWGWSGQTKAKPCCIASCPPRYSSTEGLLRLTSSSFVTLL